MQKHKLITITVAELLPLIYLCFLFRDAVTTGFAVINCTFKTLGRRLIDFVGNSLPGLGSRSLFLTKLGLSFKASVDACLLFFFKFHLQNQVVHRVKVANIMQSI
jgi:hypothetical protein